MISKEQLLATTAATKTIVYDMPEVGEVMLRPLTRTEAIQLRGKDVDILEMERRILSLAMVQPSMTEDDIAMWQDVSPAGLIEPLMRKVVQISGMTVELDKETMQSFRNGTRV